MVYGTVACKGIVIIKIQIIIIIILVGKPEGKGSLGEPDLNGSVKLRQNFGKWEGVEIAWSWLRLGSDTGHL